MPTLSEVDKIIGVFANKKRQIIDMPNLIRFALYTSMRQSEICRIRIEDLDRENKTVIIRDRKHPEEKMGNDETVPLLPLLGRSLRSALKAAHRASFFRTIQNPYAFRLHALGLKQMWHGQFAFTIYDTKRSPISLASV